MYELTIHQPVLKLVRDGVRRFSIQIEAESEDEFFQIVYEQFERSRPVLREDEYIVPAHLKFKYMLWKERHAQ